MFVKRTISDDAGFTLVEMAIVVLIAGFFFAAGVKMYSNEMEKAQYIETQDNLETSQEVINAFYFQNGRYPCPANPILTPSDPDYGREDCSCGLGMACTNVGARDADGDGVADNVMIGVVPFRDLDDNVAETPYSVAEGFDGYHNMLSYAVTEEMTSTAYNFGNPVNPRLGAINVRDYNNQAVVDPDSSAHYVIFSHGKTAEGAYKRQGNRITPCSVGGLTVPGLNPAGIQIELENCDNNDAIFIKEFQSLGDGDRFYDDVLHYGINMQSIIWRDSIFAPIGETHYYNTNSGFIGAGTLTPNTKLHVAGDIRAETQMESDLGYCDITEAGDCLDPDFLGGSGFTCPPGLVATGIENNQLVCEDIWTSGINFSSGSCPGAGEFITSFSIDNLGNVSVISCAIP